MLQNTKPNRRRRYLDYRLDSRARRYHAVISSGGGSNSAGENYSVDGTAGQPAAGVFSMLTKTQLPQLNWKLLCLAVASVIGIKWLNEG